MRPIPMAEPLLSVRDLRTHFTTQEGTIRAVDGIDFDVFEGRTLGVVGESGCGKSVTARSVLGIVEAPGKVVGGQMLLRTQGRQAGGPGQAGARQRRLSRHPRPRNRDDLPGADGLASTRSYTIGNQIIESIRLHRGLGQAGARARAIEMLDMVGLPQPRGGWTNIRTRCPAACASA